MQVPQIRAQPAQFARERRADWLDSARATGDAVRTPATVSCVGAPSAARRDEHVDFVALVHLRARDAFDRLLDAPRTGG